MIAVNQPLEAPQTRGLRSEASIDVAFVTRGPIPVSARRHAERILASLGAKAPRPIIYARFKLRVEPSRPPDEQALVQATIDVSGSRIRAHVASRNVEEALDLLDERLRRRLRRLTERRQDNTTRAAQTPPGVWRHGDLPTMRPAYFHRDPQDREIIRRKAYAPRAVSLEEALFDLEVLDHRFFLFTDQDSGEDSIVYENDDGVVVQHLSGGAPEPDRVHALSVAVNPAQAPSMSEADAIERLDTSDEPFLFFRDGETDRGKVLYRRYDGHYGLIEPAD